MTREAGREEEGHPLLVGFHWRFILPHYLDPQIDTITYDEV